MAEEWKVYKLEHCDMLWSMELELRQDEDTRKKCLEVLAFFSNGERWVSLEGGDIFKAFARFVAPIVMWESADYIKEGVIKQFEDREGFYPWTEENGIRLKEVSDFRIEPDDFVWVE